MRVVNVTNLEGGTVTGQAAGTQCRQTPLVGQLCQGVGLIHELGQRRRTEELFDRCDHRPDVDEGLRSNGFHLLRLQGHAFPDHPLHPGEADAELVLQQFAHGTDAPVAQMVDVVHGAEAVSQAVHIVQGSDDVVLDDVFGDQAVEVLADQSDPFFVVVGLLQDLFQDFEADFFVDAHFRLVKVDVAGDVHHAVGDDLDVLACLGVDQNGVHAASAMTSPVSSLTTGAARVCPAIRTARPSFLLYL